MSNIIEKRDEIAALTQKIKEEKVRSTHDPDHHETNIRNIAHGWRGDDLAVAIFPSGLSTNSALNAARTAAVSFGCDTLALTTESYQGKTDINPLTGRRWVPGEMQRAADEHGALEDGSVVETLLTFVVNRAEDVAGISQQYRIHQRINALGIISYDIEWLPEIVDNCTWEGYMVKSLVHFMNEPPLDAHAAREGINPADYGRTTDQARTHFDCVVVKELLRDGFDGAVMLLADDPERSEIIEKSLGNLAQEMP